MSDARCRFLYNSMPFNACKFHLERPALKIYCLPQLSTLINPGWYIFLYLWDFWQFLLTIYMQKSTFACWSFLARLGWLYFPVSQLVFQLLFLYLHLSFFFRSQLKRTVTVFLAVVMFKNKPRWYFSEMFTAAGKNLFKLYNTWKEIYYNIETN